MGSMRQQYADVLDAVEAWGEADAAATGRDPTDETLWVQARTKAPDVFGPAVQPDLLTALRYAYDRGRYRSRIRLSEVADLLTKAGHDAVITHGGSGIALIKAGPVDAYLDGQDYARWAASAGPGHFDHTAGAGTAGAVADTSGGFSVGPDDADTSVEAFTVVDAPMSPRAIAELIDAQIRAEIQRRERIGVAVEAAERAFWAAIAAAFPEVDGTDFAPDAARRLSAALHQAARTWLYANQPAAGLAATGTAVPAGWFWNAHTNDLGDWCEHSHTSAAADSDEDARCPSGCADSYASQQRS